MTGPGGVAHELRVHGVAGTPPESMLQLEAIEEGDHTQDGMTAARTGPRRRTQGTDEITLWRAPRRDARVRAWSWRSLTSGRWYQAFYLLLLPFMIANLAGWMLAGDGPVASMADSAGPAVHRTARLRWAALLVRLVGVLVTVVFVVSVQLVVADLVGWQWLYRQQRWALGLTGLGTVVTALVFLGLVYLTRIRPKPEEMPADRSIAAWWTSLGEQWRRPRDPVGIGYLARRQWVLWHSGAVNVALRRLHLTAGLAVTALLAALPVGGTTVPWLRLTTLVLASVSLAAVLVFLGWIGLRRGSDAPRDRALDDGDQGLELPFRLVRWVLVVPAGAALVLAALLPLGWSETVVQRWDTLPALRGSAVWVTVAVVALVVLLTLVNLGGRRAANPGAVLLLGASVGAGFGAGVISRAAGLVGGLARFPPVIDDFVPWLAVAVTTSLALVVVAGTVRWLWGARAGGSAVPALTARGSWLTTIMGTVGLALTVVIVVQVRSGAQVADLPRGFAIAVVLGLAVPAVVIACVVAARRGPAVLAGVVGVLAVVAVVVVWAVLTGRSLRIAGIDVPPATFADFCLSVAVVVPTAAILGRIVAGLRNASVRRGVGVLWDIGTFWPRWFHPLAPPTYSDRAVPRLAEQLDVDLAVRGAVLLAPHSQGTVIANAALLLPEDPAARPEIALLSYGSPWGRLYAEFFPTQVHDAMTEDLAARLGGRWRNLWRPSDPIGGRIPALSGDTEIAHPVVEGHSDYWVEPVYAAARDELRGQLG
jgi:uncharacterized integral membrane protein